MVMNGDAIVQHVALRGNRIPLSAKIEQFGCLSSGHRGTSLQAWLKRGKLRFPAENAGIAFKRSPVMPDWVEACPAASHVQLGQMGEAW